MLEAPNIFPDDPDAQQAFVDALPIVAELLTASARVPANTQQGRSLRGLARQSENERAQQAYIQDLTEQLQLKAERIGITVNELLEQGTETVKRQARQAGLSQPGRVASIGRVDEDGSALREKALLAEGQFATATRARTAAIVALRAATEALAFAKVARNEARRELLAYEQSSLAA